MRRTVVLDVVGLTPQLLGEHTPALCAFAAQGALRTVDTIVPAVTCSVQSTFLTGALPRDHGAVANGWYFRELAEPWLWRQSNRLVAGEKLWDAARRRDPSFTVASLFWWYNMYAQVDWSVTPRPVYTADGRKLPDIYTQPDSLRGELTRCLGDFPLFNFWGPAAGIRSSRWIADAALHLYERERPTLTLVYLPHLDYDLQRHGPDDPRVHVALREIDAICGELIERFRKDGASVLVVSEYGVTSVSGPIHLNRALRAAGLLAVRDELGTDKLDAGASAAFAVADHQLAHVYVRDPERIREVQALVAGLDGVEQVLDPRGQAAIGLDHPRSGELVAIARADRWFTYYHWLDDERAPDYARTVDIHRKSGYDPCELFLDPTLPAPRLHVAWALARKAVGMRSLVRVIPLDASLVRGSHGRPTDDAACGPLVISSEPELLEAYRSVPATAMKDLMLSHLFEELRSPTRVAAAAGS